MLYAGRYRYAKEKLSLTVRYVATAAGDARSRLEGTYSQIHLLREEHVPPDAWQKISGVMKRLTEGEGEGKVQANARRVKNATAAKLLGDIWEAYEIVERAYQTDVGGRAV
jgi:hypothetical protein